MVNQVNLNNVPKIKVYKKQIKMSPTQELGFLKPSSGSSVTIGVASIARASVVKASTIKAP